MAAALEQVLSRGADAALSENDALALAEVSHTELPALCEAAAARRNRGFGPRLTFSPKVFLPLTNLCRNFCDYCSFRKSPGDHGEWTMSRAEIDEWLARGRDQGA